MALKRTHEQFLAEVREITNGEIEILSEYKGTKRKVTAKHLYCGHTWDVRADHLIHSKSGCPKCKQAAASNGGKLKTHDDFVREVNDLTNGEYLVLDRYLFGKVKIRMKHVTCGHEYKVKPQNFLHCHARCPKCRLSKAEETIKKILVSKKVEFKKEFYINECRDKNPMPFDFALFDKGQLKCLIEYDGEHHFEPVNFGKRGNLTPEERLANLQRRDRLKDAFCKENNIKLYRIAYWERDNLENIIDVIISNEF